MPEPETTLADLIARCPEHGTATETWPECRCAAARKAAAWLDENPETTPPAPPVPGLRDQIAGALLARIKQAVIIDPGPFSGMVGQPFAATEYDLADAVLAVVQPVIDQPQHRAEAAEAMTAEVTEALRLANRELDAAATKWDLDLDKRTADLTQRAEKAEAALARVRDLVADMQGVTGARWWAEQLETALTPPADQPDTGGAR